MSVNTLRSVKISVLFGILFAFAIIHSGMVFAAAELPKPDDLGLPFQSASPEGVATSIGKIIKQAIMFSGILAIMALTYAGILMMLSYGDESKVKSAKAIIQYALIGVVLSGAAYAIIEALNALQIT